ncbi:hypothetical protein CkaCkLH20_00531 [Colletotrichum karsti]|uniref:Uncharacterized protein n=1 Tax=Colletotrichum karsti TaxID=1095194 RepID=A0A9P6LQP0_9PEZI|nr:uncharacterized protein CkaCkLH20_00531 [Colletotrichum karsti]KAF9882495.1 hypothetical protein CkaCkLH20_00531 [Colletotrichum karsti]
MRLQTLALNLSFLVGLVATADEPKGGSCEKYNLYKCGESAFDAAELAEIAQLQEDGPLDARSIDFSAADEEVGFNITKLVRRSDFQDLQGDKLHARVEEVLGALVAGPSSDNEILKRFKLEVRAGYPTPKSFCGKKLIYDLPGYPSGDKLYDVSDWGNCEDFNLKLPPRSGDTKPAAGREHQDEHVLEMNMLQQFGLEVLLKTPDPDDDPQNDKVTMCDYLKRYWMVSGGRGGQLNIVNERKVWTLVGDAWPHMDEAGEKEMVRVDKEVNGLKTLLFQVSSKDIHNKKTIMKKAENIKTVHYVINKLRVAVVLADYLNNADVNKIYYRQAKRVGEAMDVAENGLVENWKAQPTPYRKQDLRDKWMAWIDTYTDALNKKLKTFMVMLVEVVEKHIEDGEKELKTMDTDRKKLHERMKATAKKVREVTKTDTLFKNPFKPGAAPADTPPGTPDGTPPPSP